MHPHPYIIYDNVAYTKKAAVIELIKQHNLELDRIQSELIRLEGIIQNEK
jgi:hypothetical protein